MQIVSKKLFLKNVLSKSMARHLILSYHTQQQDFVHTQYYYSFNMKRAGCELKRPIQIWYRETTDILLNNAAVLESNTSLNRQIASFRNYVYFYRYTIYQWKIPVRDKVTKRWFNRNSRKLTCLADNQRRSQFLY